MKFLKYVSVFLGLAIFFGVVWLVYDQFGDIDSCDWPMWRYDPARSASSPQKLPDKLSLLWVRDFPAPVPTWDDPLNQDLMQFDRSYEPIVVGKTMLLGSNANDCVRAIDTESGEVKWTRYVDGPIRLPLAAAGDFVYFTSDDGYLYCLNVHDGEIRWRFQGAPDDRKVLGNKRLISAWCARGGPVVKDGIVYFGAGIWPFMGIFLYALDAETGEIVWENSGIGSTYMKQPHNSPSYAGVAPQGSLVISGDKLLVPGGRSVPAGFDLKTGEMIYYHLARYNKMGGAFVAASSKYFVNYYRDQVCSLFDSETGQAILLKFVQMPVITERRIYSKGEKVVAFDLANLIWQPVNRENIRVDSKKKSVKLSKERPALPELPRLWELEVDATGDLIEAGGRLYAGGKGVVSAIEKPGLFREAKIKWQKAIEGTVSRLVAADRKLFVVTLDGRIYAFGHGNGNPKFHPWEPEEVEAEGPAEEWVEELVESTGIDEGYCMIYGIDDVDLLIAIRDETELHVCVVVPDRSVADHLRSQLDAHGISGEMMSVGVGDIETFNAPKYIASLTIMDASNLTNERSIRILFDGLRPYGGTAYLITPKSNREKLMRLIDTLELPGSAVRESEDAVILVREGKLPGSDYWTHQYGDVANTVKSDDQLVKLPLGLLWFGGNSNLDVLPRHGHGPPEQVIGGRLFIEGMDRLSARDVYTGRVLWKRVISDLNNHGIYFDDTYADTPLSTAYNQVHIPGANARGTNFIATIDLVYVLKKDRCLVLDAATGRTVRYINLPDDYSNGEWSYIGIDGENLIAGFGFADYTSHIEPDEIGLKSTEIPAFYNFDVTASRNLVVMDRHSTEIKWSRDANFGFRHNAIVAGNGMLFCIDALPGKIEKAIEKWIAEPQLPKKALIALDIETGKPIWEENEKVFGTWLGYSVEHDVLIQSGRKSRDMIVGEPEGIIAYRGKTGEILWEADLSDGGPYMIHGDKIITDRHAYDLMTGEQVMRESPLTGQLRPWEYKRDYGCNYVIASEHLLTFRSAAAGYYDLRNDGGTGSIGGFKSGCTSNLIAADGVLNAPDYTRTCSCSYQNQTSLALIHMPDVEVWTSYYGDMGDGPIKRVGLNFGAPGDRRAENGILWLEYPRVGGPSPDVSVTFDPEKPKRLIIHSSKIDDCRLKWVAASGVEGIKTITVDLSGIITDDEDDNEDDEEKKPRTLTARTYSLTFIFCDLENTSAGERIFDVAVQGDPVLTGFDIVAESGGTRRSVERKITGIRVLDKLIISFTPKQGSKPALISGIEIVETD